jgi:hypothetical protein
MLLVVLMVGAAATLLMTMSSQLQTAGQDRAQALALYAAEHAIAQGKAYIASKPNDYSVTLGWTSFLTDTANANVLCVSNGASAAAPTPTPRSANPATSLMLDSAGNPITTWQYCIHNNADDPGYLDPANNTPAGTYNGEVSDSRDQQHYLVIEGYGVMLAGGSAIANSHLTVTIGIPTTSGSLGNDTYAQEGGGAAHGGATGAGEVGITVGSGSVSF